MGTVVSKHTLNPDRFERGATFAQYLAAVVKNRELWREVHGRAQVPDDLLEKARRVPGRWHLVAISEDWCGDAVNTLPIIARLASEAGWDLRVMGRDDNPDLMDAHLTDGRSRSIPVVIVYDEAFREIGWWGPRPSELQSWVLREGLAMSSPERYKVVRRWYARDRGRSTLSELLDLFPRSA
jgi:hypothetical protein